jgi:transcriptional regulator with XRE-family HTH domain
MKSKYRKEMRFFDLFLFLNGYTRETFAKYFSLTRQEIERVIHLSMDGGTSKKLKTFCDTLGVEINFLGDGELPVFEKNNVGISLVRKQNDLEKMLPLLKKFLDLYGKPRSRTANKTQYGIEKQLVTFHHQTFDLGEVFSRIGEGKKCFPTVDGEKVRELRIKIGKLQEEIGMEVYPKNEYPDITPNAAKVRISTLERGERKSKGEFRERLIYIFDTAKGGYNPEARRLADALGTTPEYLGWLTDNPAQEQKDKNEETI